MIYVIDASYYVFRAWFSIPDSMIDADKNPVNALYGFTRFLGDFLEEIEPEYVAVAFDRGLRTCFRNEIYPEYKANRDPAPPELKLQFERCQAVARAMGMADYAEERFEADDIIGTVAVRMREEGLPSTILSRDKDLAQLLKEGDSMWDFSTDQRIGYEDVHGRYGVRPEQMVDYLALAGDSVDNIPGVRGVGPKTAAALLAHFDSFDEVYANLGSVVEVKVRGAAKLGARLAEHREDALMSRQLSQIHCDVPVETTRQTLTRKPPDLGHLNHLYDAADFGSSLRRQAERIADQF
jgi:DNA polymerase-1